MDADLTRQTQVFSNLLNNAAKFTEHGGWVRLAVQLIGAEVSVSVTDNGIGIPTHMLPHVPEMFTQVEGSLQGSQGGLGIGLSIVQRLVQMHGGSVVVSSDGPGKGSQFVVRLPLALQLVGEKVADESDPDCSTECLRILVADDNVDAAESLAILLTLEGNETRTAHGARRASSVERCGDVQTRCTVVGHRDAEVERLRVMPLHRTATVGQEHCGDRSDRMGSGR